MAGRIFQPIIGSTNTPTYIKQGVEDKSESIRIAGETALMKNMGEMGRDIKKGYELARLERAQEAEIERYMSPELLKNAKADSMGLQGAIDKMWSDIDNPIDSSQMEKINPIEIKLRETKDRVSRYQKMVDQGIISPEEFTQRITATTREAVNRMPGLYPEIIEHSRKVLGLSGIEEIVALNKQTLVSQQKAQQEQLKNLRELADKFNISYDTLNPNYGKMQQEVHERQAQVRVSQMLDEQHKAKTTLTKEQALNWVQTEGPQVIMGDTYRLTSQFSDLFRNAGPQDFANLKYQMGLMANNAKNRLVAVASSHGIVNEPHVQDIIKRHAESVDTLVKGLEGLQSGRDAADKMKNMQERLDAEQKYNFAMKYDVPSLNAMRMLPDAVWQKWATNRDSNAEGLMAITSSLVKTSIDSPAFQKSLTSDAIKRGTPDAVSTTFGFQDGGDPQSFVNSVKTLRTSVIDKPQFKTEEEKFNVMKGFIQELGKPDRKGKFVNVPSETIQDAFKISDEFVQTTSRFMAQKAQEFGDVKAEVLPDGRLVFNSKNPEHAAHMNKNYASYINESIVGLANIMNTSTTEAAKMVYPRYRDLFGTANQSFGTIKQTQPKSGLKVGTSREEVLADFNSTEKTLLEDLRDFKEGSAGWNRVNINLNDLRKERDAYLKRVR